MELRGVGPDGRPVKASVSDFAEKLRRGGESLSFGTSPTHAVYRSQTSGEVREVDLQETAQAAGIKNVQFHFDPKQARDNGLLVERDIDQGVAYNLERIKLDDGKQAYLADKGFSNVYRNGDDFYGFENGKMFTINNRPGLDLSDLTRMGAHAGRDLGAATAVTAAIGGSAVAALPTGGASVAAGVAMAGVAGAAGGVVGEAAQRGIDSLVGADAARYNARMTGSEEAQAYAGDAAMGAVAGVAQPLMALGGAQIAKNVAAPAARTLLGEYGATKAAQWEASAMMTRLPQGFNAKWASPEQASAMDALQQGVKMSKAGQLGSEELTAVAGEARQMLKPGSAKQPLDAAEEHFVQEGLRKQYQSQTLEAAKAKSVEAEMAKAQAKKNAEDVAVLVERHKQNAQEVLAPYKKELETVFNENASLDDSIKAQRKVVSSQSEKFARNLGLKLDRDAASGEVLGIESSSLRDFVETQASNVFDGATDHLNAMRSSEAFLSRAAPDGLKGDTVKRIRAVAGNIDKKVEDGALADAVSGVLKGIENHGLGVKNSDASLREAVEKFHGLSIRLADQYKIPKETRKAVDVVNAALHKFEIGSTRSPDLVNSYYAGYHKLVEVKSVLGVNRGAHNPDVFENLVRGLDQVARTTGDKDAYTVQPLVNTLHLDQVLTGEVPLFRDMLTGPARSNFDALQFVKSYQHVGKEVVSTRSEQLKKVGAGAFGAAVATATGNDPLTGFAIGYSGGKTVSSQVGKAALGQLKKVGAAGSGALSTMKKLGEKVTDNKVAKMAKDGRRTYVTMEAEEAYVDDRKRKRRK